MRIVVCAEVLDDSRIVDSLQRKKDVTALRAIIEDALVAAVARSGGKRLNDAGARWAGIRRSEEVNDHPEIVVRRAIEVAEIAYGVACLVGRGFRWRTASAGPARRSRGLACTPPEAARSRLLLCGDHNAAARSGYLTHHTLLSE